MSKPTFIDGYVQSEDLEPEAILDDLETAGVISDYYETEIGSKTYWIVKTSGGKLTDVEIHDEMLDMLTEIFGEKDALDILEGEEPDDESCDKD